MTSAIAEAFELLQDEVNAEIAQTNEAGSAAFAAGEHQRASAALEQANELKDLQQQLKQLKAAFPGLLRPTGTDAPRTGRGKALTPASGQGGPARTRALPRGHKTGQAEYRVPILRALVELGGGANLSAVLDRVHVAMKDRLNEHDLAPLPSNQEIRWRNTAQWERNRMRQEGLLRDDSPQGVWEITDLGRQALEKAGQLGLRTPEDTAKYQTPPRHTEQARGRSRDKRVPQNRPVVGHFEPELIINEDGTVERYDPEKARRR